MLKLVVLGVALVVAISLITLFVVSKTTDSFTVVGQEGQLLKYLQQIYPLGTNLHSEQFNRLECLFTSLLPEKTKDHIKGRVYTANLPGPSCSQLPCGCDSDGIPDVKFAADPLLEGKWPPCNVQGDDATLCCSSVDAYKKCMKEGKVKWVGNDTWDGNIANASQCPPSMGQFWKPALWPPFTLAVNKYPPNDWNSFYNAAGDPSDTWIEVIHSSFAIDTVTLGVWFYRAIGTGIFVNLGKTFVAINKIEAIIKLGMSWTELAEFILRPNTGSLLTDPVTIPETGLGGAENLDFWLAGQYHTNLANAIKSLAPAGNDTKQQVVNLLKQAVYGLDYNLNRINNTGTLDSLIISLARPKKINSLQFTVQPNLYNGFTTELMILGTERQIFTDVDQIPKNQYRVMDPNNLPRGSNTSSEGQSCTFDMPLACAYCEEAPATMNAQTGCTTNVDKWKHCLTAPNKY
jgi:hypothetical protein